MLSVHADAEDTALSVEFQMTGEMQDITQHEQDFKLAQLARGRGQHVARPGDEVVGQLNQQDEHLLSGKKALVAFGDWAAVGVPAEHVIGEGEHHDAITSLAIRTLKEEHSDYSDCRDCDDAFEQLAL
jgi:hypothetical protein